MNEEDVIRTGVHRAMKNAIANGYDVMMGTSLSVAIDLAQYDAQLEKYQPEQLLFAVEEFRRAKLEEAAAEDPERWDGLG